MLQVLIVGISQRSVIFINILKVNFMLKDFVIEIFSILPQSDVNNLIIEFLNQRALNFKVWSDLEVIQQIEILFHSLTVKPE